MYMYVPTCTYMYLHCLQVMDVINEEEQQFLKTLSHGRQLFEKAVARMGSNNFIIPGSWLLQH